MVSEEKKKKKVNFNLSENKIHNMYVWLFAYQAARSSDMARIAADKFRFNLRKKRLEELLIKIGFFSRTE